jgi:hypothetical protein
LLPPRNQSFYKKLSLELKYDQNQNNNKDFIELLISCTRNYIKQSYDNHLNNFQKEIIDYKFVKRTSFKNFCQSFLHILAIKAQIESLCLEIGSSIFLFICYQIKLVYFHILREVQTVTQINTSPWKLISLLENIEQKLRELLAILESILPYKIDDFKILNVLLHMKKRHLGFQSLFLESCLSQMTQVMQGKYPLTED